MANSTNQIEPKGFYLLNSTFSLNESIGVLNFPVAA